MTTSYTGKLKRYAETAAKNLPDFLGNFEAVAEYFSYTFTPGQKTKREIEEFLFSKIAENLNAINEEFPHKTFKKIRSQLVIDELVYGLDIHDAYTVSEIIWDATRQIKIKDITEEKLWIECCELALAKRALGYDPYNLRHSHTEDINYAKAIQFFKGMKIHISTIDGDIPHNDKEISKIPDAITHRAKFLGHLALDNLNADLSKLYSSKLERFVIQRNVNPYNPTREPSIPYGYLLNIVVKFLTNEPRKRIDEKKLWQETKEISKNFIALYELEPYTPYRNMYGMGENFVTTIQHSVLYDNIFLFKQLPFKYAKPIIESLFEVDSNIAENLENEIGIGLIDIYNLLDHFESYAKDQKTINLVFTKNWLEHTQTRVQISKIEVFLNLFSRSPSTLNKAYNTPFDYTKSEIDDYPIIKTDHLTYKIINIAILPVQIFERYASIIREYDQKCIKNNRVNIDQVIGDNMEKLLANYLSKSGITFFNGEQYQIDTSKRSFLKTARQQGECDFIIETENTIFFLELKKKSLTRRSSSGHVEDILNDMAMSFLSAQVQAGYHEAILRQYGEISFISGSILKHKNRDIQRVSVSLLDFHALQDQSTIDNILYSLIGSKVTSKSDDADVIRKLENLQKYIDDLTNMIQLDSMKHYQNTQGRPYANIRYFSIPQLLILLENCNANDDFEKEINVTRCATDGSLNWYTQYERLRDNIQMNEITSHPNLHDAIIQI